MRLLCCWVKCEARERVVVRKIGRERGGFSSKGYVASWILGGDRGNCVGVRRNIHDEIKQVLADIRLHDTMYITCSLSLSCLAQAFPLKPIPIYAVLFCAFLRPFNLIAYISWADAMAIPS
jgi:hypothetical protein